MKPIDTPTNLFRTLLFVSLIGLIPRFGTAQSKAGGYLSPAPSVISIDSTITCYADLRYGPVPDSVNTASSDRIFDLYLPHTMGLKDKLPLFLFIHGGGFSGGGKSLKELCTAMARKGYAVASINYRLTLKNNKVHEANCGVNMSKGLPVGGRFHPLLQKAVANASDDAAIALTFLSTKAAAYHLDTGKIFICGGSAGAMTALHLAYISKKPHPPVKAVVDLWGGLEDAGKIAAANVPPVLIIHGDKDDTINIDYAYALQRRMQEIGSALSGMIILKDKGHAQYQYVTDHLIGDIDAFLNRISK
ncbi:alpha/beta hydrolase fold domain-containing protein [Mucilaginibacter sp. RS28]|uniref:Alpha/beta hydrolase fold domain-containing protein n=1 Tax=Mucilaginibacter straminoryzae TaxID=2932774 RepID=A0A9X2B814_9SPHI|nr:alpha/beta hydrolase fold domain-containing protein [Mucilaginibacter straminoryzae]MCJ8208996.1 alpha/beta hydrolase fold domain-containing protein [Mucilaginibacter straminoryzae]